MVRIFEAGETDFSNNGLVVINPIKCKVTHKLEGDFYLDLTCGKEYLDYIQPSYLVVAPTPQGDQAFRIKSVTKTGARIEVKAWHVMYDLQNYLVFAAIVSNKNCEDALLYAKSRTDTTCPFSLTSDIETTNSYTGSRKDMLTVLQEIANLYEGHIIPDNWSVAVNSSIGVDNQITISYGKNLEELTAEYDFSDVCTKILPIGKDDITLPSYYLTGPTQYDVPYSRVVTFEQDIDPEDYTVDEVVSWQSYQNALKNDLREKATAYLQEHQYPVVNYTLKGKPEMVSDVGDIIQVKDKRIGVDLLTQVISYEFDCIREAYVSLEFGNFTDSLGTLLDDLKTSIINETNYTVQNSVSTVNNSLITTRETLTENIEGGYAAIIDGILYIGDASPVEDATEVYRWGSDGLSRSEDGLNGTYYPVIDHLGFTVYDDGVKRTDLSLGVLSMKNTDGDLSVMLSSDDSNGNGYLHIIGDTSTLIRNDELEIGDIELGPYKAGEKIRCNQSQYLVGYITTSTAPGILTFTVILPRALPHNKTLTVESLNLTIRQDGDTHYNLGDVATNSNYTVTVASRSQYWLNSLSIMVNANPSAYFSIHGVVSVILNDLKITVAD